ncbi:MAG: hypothetical protein AW08_03779 [Candidatus Accumulibacter adjunctus]|uniref:Uncharacterized protein n=1 Tax=Candidatus Accumulibacter adjunctus TaxID=1454001 RepID=A0A011PCX1_9PROT|nr:MAG: hypothetical protein AW08_03779 [Candidatus Accumulibacter adjunctus]
MQPCSTALANRCSTVTDVAEEWEARTDAVSKPTRFLRKALPAWLCRLKAIHDPQETGNMTGIAKAQRSRA